MGLGGISRCLNGVGGGLLGLRMVGKIQVGLTPRGIVRVCGLQQLCLTRGRRGRSCTGCSKSLC